MALQLTKTMTIRRGNLIEFSVLPIGSLLMEDRRIPSWLRDVLRSSLLATICHIIIIFNPNLIVRLSESYYYYCSVTLRVPPSGHTA